MLLYIAGHETTANLIGNGLTNLFRFPEQIDLLRADPGLDANAVEEMLRLRQPGAVHPAGQPRGVEVGGVTIPAGSLLTLSLGSANRDPRKWGPTADVLDVARPGANEHVSFGGGPHFCLGNALARLETRPPSPSCSAASPAWQPAARRAGLDAPHHPAGVETLPVILG